MAGDSCAQAWSVLSPIWTRRRSVTSVGGHPPFGSKEVNHTFRILAQTATVLPISYAPARRSGAVWKCVRDPTS